jgi:hypothetical protein
LELHLPRRIVGSGCMAGSILELDEQIRARIREAKLWDKDSKLEDFQIQMHENGLVLINLKTRRAQLLYDEESELLDWKELFPNVVVLK